MKPDNYVDEIGFDLRMKLIAHALGEWHKIPADQANARQTIGEADFSDLRLTRRETI